jgi:hypothetical protein
MPPLNSALTCWWWWWIRYGLGQWCTAWTSGRVERTERGVWERGWPTGREGKKGKCEEKSVWEGKRLITGGIQDLGSRDLEMDLGEKFVRFRSVVSGGRGGMTRTGRWRGIERGVARRVWTRVAEKKEDLGAEVRITGVSKGPFTWVRDSHPSPPSGSWLSIILFTLYLASASPTLSWICLPLPV